MILWKKLVSPGIRLVIVPDYSQIFDGITTIISKIDYQSKQSINVATVVTVMYKTGEMREQYLFPTVWRDSSYSFQNNISPLIGENVIAVKVETVINRDQKEEILVVCDEAIN